MTVDGIFLFIGLLVNAIVVLYVTRLQLNIQKTINSTGDTLRVIREETNGMRVQLEEVARAEGHRAGQQEERDKKK